MTTTAMSTVGEIARLAGVTVRTLHHYDEVGLVVASGRTEAGYRLYAPSDVARLQEVLLYRELGFALAEIRDLLDAGGSERLTRLRRQRDLLVSKAERFLAMVDAVDRTIEAERQGMMMTNEDMLEVFGGFDPAEYEAEARERWGGTEAYRQSARRTARYGKTEWEQIKREVDEINSAFLELMSKGTDPTDDAAMDVAERHREHITKWFYECPRPAHGALGEMYVADPRFTANIDEAGEGLARYMRDAMVANATR